MISCLLATALADARLDALLDGPNLRGATVGFVLADKDGKVLHSRNADLRMIPASNQKILSCAFAMGALGPDAVIKTRIWKTEEGLIVDAPGDPSLTTKDLTEAAARLKTPSGSLVRVRQAFRVGPPPTWEWDDLPFRYAPPITALSVDRASWELFAEKGEVIPPSRSLGVAVRRLRQTGEVSSRFDPWSQAAFVDGALPTERTRIGVFALPSPDRTAAALLGGRLMAHTGPLPEREPDVTLTSPPVRTLIKDCLEPSDNLYAEHLMLLGALAQGPLDPSDPYPAAAARMRAFFVEKVGLTPADLRPTDGSGLSRQNLVTPGALVKILRWADLQPWGALYREALAAPGEGTLASRLQTVKFTGKTGTINAVSSLSGIISPGDDSRLYVSIVFNGALATSRQLRDIQDELVRLASSLSRHAHS